MHGQKTEKMLDEEEVLILAVPAVFAVVVAGVVLRRGYFQLRLLPFSVPFLY